MLRPSIMSFLVAVSSPRPSLAPEISWNATTIIFILTTFVCIRYLAWRIFDLNGHFQGKNNKIGLSLTWESWNNICAYTSLINHTKKNVLNSSAILSLFWATHRLSPNDVISDGALPLKWSSVWRSTISTTLSSQLLFHKWWQIRYKLLLSLNRITCICYRLVISTFWSWSNLYVKVCAFRLPYIWGIVTNRANMYNAIKLKVIYLLRNVTLTFVHDPFRRSKVLHISNIKIHENITNKATLLLLLNRKCNMLIQLIEFDVDAFWFSKSEAI